MSGSGEPMLGLTAWTLSVLQSPMREGLDGREPAQGKFGGAAAEGSVELNRSNFGYCSRRSRAGANRVAIQASQKDSLETLQPGDLCRKSFMLLLLAC